ncbi:MAG: CopD family protein [Deltaproteobacteria bacterium]|nr:CopD family protein [Deltaproteobacteria bacterium]
MSIIVFRYLHFLGITFWIGSAVAVAIAAAAPSPLESGIAQSLRKITIRVTTPAMLFAFAGGFGMLIPNFAELYAKQGWMHTKLVLLLVLAGATGVLTGKLRRWAEGQEVSPAAFGKLAWTLSILAVLIITLAIFRPFSG